MALSTYGCESLPFAREIVIEQRYHPKPCVAVYVSPEMKWHASWYVGVKAVAEFETRQQAHDWILANYRFNTFNGYPQWCDCWQAC